MRAKAIAAAAGFAIGVARLAGTVHATPSFQIVPGYQPSSAGYGTFTLSADGTRGLLRYGGPGTQLWSTAPAENVFSRLFATSGLSPDGLWALGFDLSMGAGRMNRAGAFVAAPPGGGVTPFDVSASSTDNSVMVGTGDLGTGPGYFRSVAGVNSPVPLADPSAGIGDVAPVASGDASVIAASTFHGGQPTPMRWTTGAGSEFLAANAGGFLRGRATGVSADGGTIIGGLLSAVFGWRWTADGKDTPLLGLPGDVFTTGFAISADGALVGGVSLGTTETAVLWGPGGVALRLGDVLAALGVSGHAGYDLLSITGMSADGLTVSGVARASGGNLVPFVAQIPAPGTAATMAAGLASVRRRRRRP